MWRIVRRTATVGAIAAAAGLATPGIASGLHEGDHDGSGPSPGPPRSPIIPEVTVNVENELPDYLEIEMENLIVSDIRIGRSSESSDEDASPTETVTLNFGEIEVEHTPHDPDDDDDKSITVEPWGLGENSST